MKTARQLALAVALLGLGGCGPKTIDYSVNVISKVCDTSLDPFDGVNFVQIRVSGTGIDVPLIAQSARTDQKLEIPQIPAGPNRVIEVRGYADDPSAGATAPISVGRSIPFTIPDVISDSNQLPEVNIFLRKVDTFTPTSTAADPHDCAQMRGARAAHTATLLSDGRVFIAGGFDTDLTDGGRAALNSTEFYNPNTGAFDDAPRIISGTSAIQKAFHTASLIKGSDNSLANEAVVLHGGETYTSNGVQPSTSTFVLSLGKNAYGLVPSHYLDGGAMYYQSARTRHVAVTIPSGQVLFIGGLLRSGGGSNSLAPVPFVEWYDPTNAHINRVDSDVFQRVDATATVVQDGGLVAVVGGVDDAGTVLDTVSYFAWTGNDFQLSTTTQQLKTARRGAAAVTLSDDSSILVMGGYSDGASPIPVDTDSATEIVRTSTNTVDSAASVGPRGNICAALLQSGTVLAIGGRTIDMGASNPRSDGTATLLAFDPKNGTISGTGAASLPARSLHTCTTLADGTVLVTGGVSEADGNQTVLQDAWIYTPVPGE